MSLKQPAMLTITNYYPGSKRALEWPQTHVNSALIFNRFSYKFLSKGFLEQENFKNAFFIHFDKS